MTKYIQISIPVDKVREEMASTYIRHVLQTRIRTFFYNGLVSMVFIRINKFITFFLSRKKKQRKPLFYCQKILHYKTQSKTVIKRVVFSKGISKSRFKFEKWKI